MCPGRGAALLQRCTAGPGPTPARNMGPGSASLARCAASGARKLSERRNTMPDNPPIIAGTRIGHVHLKVADLDRALAFYCGVLGFEMMQRLSSGAAFISAGGYHHHIGLNTWESKAAIRRHRER